MNTGSPARTCPFPVWGTFELSKVASSGCQVTIRSRIDDPADDGCSQATDKALQTWRPGARLECRVPPLIREGKSGRLVRPRCGVVANEKGHLSLPISPRSAQLQAMGKQSVRVTESSSLGHGGHVVE